MTVSVENRSLPMRRMQLFFLLIAIGRRSFSAAVPSDRNNSHGSRNRNGSDNGCACSPSQYEFVFDFSSTCPPVNIAASDAIISAECFVTTIEYDGNAAGNRTDVSYNITYHSLDNRTASTPIKAVNVEIFELDDTLQLLDRQSYSGPFVDGDRLIVDSIIRGDRDASQQPEDIPSVLQVNIFAVNQYQQDLINVFSVAFSNDCDVYPSLESGQSAGWLVIDKVQDPSRAYCPAAPNNDDRSATASPSPRPSMPDDEKQPSLRPTLAPTRLSSSLDMSLSMSMSMSMEMFVTTSDDQDEFGDSLSGGSDTWYEFGRES